MCALSFARRLKDNLNFWKMSSNSRSGGGFARIDNIPSPRSFFFDFRLRRRFSSSLKAAAACCSRAKNFSMSSKHLLRMLTSFSYLSLEVELVSSNFSLPPSNCACIRGEGCEPSYAGERLLGFESVGDICGDILSEGRNL